MAAHHHEHMSSLEEKVVTFLYDLFVYYYPCYTGKFSGPSKIHTALSLFFDSFAKIPFLSPEQIKSTHEFFTLSLTLRFPDQPSRKVHVSIDVDMYIVLASIQGNTDIERTLYTILSKRLTSLPKLFTSQEREAFQTLYGCQMKEVIEIVEKVEKLCTPPYPLPHLHSVLRHLQTLYSCISDIVTTHFEVTRTEKRQTLISKDLSLYKGICFSFDNTSIFDKRWGHIISAFDNRMLSHSRVLSVYTVDHYINEYIAHEKTFEYFFQDEPLDQTYAYLHYIGRVYKILHTPLCDKIG